MKTRKGFVSNSSSSSFIIGFEKKPKTPEELQELMFPNEEQFFHPYDECSYPVKKIAEYVFEDVSKARQLNKPSLREALNCGYIDGAPDYFTYTEGAKYGTPKYQDAVKKHDEASAKFLEKLAQEIEATTKGLKLYNVNYSDNDGRLECALEHGDVFNNIYNFRISCH